VIAPRGGTATALHDGAAIATATRSAPSLSAALDALVPAIRDVVDRDQPERPLDERERATMTAIGVRDRDELAAYDAVIDEFFSTSIVDTTRLGRATEAMIARDPQWAHPYALLALIQGDVTAEAAATRARGHAAADRTRDPVGWLLLQGFSEQVVADVDRAFAATPDDLVTAWYLHEWLRRLHRPVEAVAALRVMHERRPDLQFGNDLQAALTTAGHPGEAAEVQAEWLRSEPENEQALTTQAVTDLEAGRHDEAVATTRELRALYGDPTQLLMLAIHVAIVSADLPEATADVTAMLRRNAYERALAWFELGQIEILQGHFSAARDAWRTCVRDSTSFGAQGPLLQSLEELTAMDTLLGDTAALGSDADQLVAQYGSFGDPEQADAHRIERAGLVPPKHCLDVAAMLAHYSREDGREGYQRRVWRSAAEAGCVPCADVVRLGGSPEERSTRSLFRFAQCAEQVGQLELARDAYARARKLSTLFDNAQIPATAYAILSSFRLARVLARLGRTDEAKAAYAAFLDRWDHSDRPIPEVEQARRALGR
jgi:tetratricopeptide (TPR) repeat protein